MDSKEPVYGLYDALLTHEGQAFLDKYQQTVRQQLSLLRHQDRPEIYLRQHLVSLIDRILSDASKEARLDVVNEIINALSDLAPGVVGARDRVTPQVLEALLRHTEFQQESHTHRPQIPLSRSALLTNERTEHLIGSELAREIYWADRIDCLCAFIKWSGLRQVLEPLRVFFRRGGVMRVITTTYMQATDQRALDRLVELGAEVRVSYDTGRTRLHAKAWLFHRKTDFTTAYIGSSNLSESALMHGLEWNVRASIVDSRAIVERFAAAFDAYWQDAHFEPYDGRKEHAARLAGALDQKRAGQPTRMLELHPYDFQQEILERLEVERFVHGRKSNLVIAATGTGKTVIAALDYRRLCKKHGSHISLLFVAHRREILDQSRRTFQIALRDETYGEIYAGGLRPEQGVHVFASVQSLAKVNLANVNPHQFDMVIVDEFHHAAAKTYERLLKHFRPNYLLGLTATPERADGQDVLGWFEGRMAAELRLWDAISIQRLVPFQYFGVADDTDLSQIKWSGGQYDGSELTQLYTADNLRVRIIVRALESRVLNIRKMRAIGFCVSVRHAEFMAEQFSKLGIPSMAITGQTKMEDRAAAIRNLKQLKLNVLFTVDVLTEGVDIPEVDTVLLLRPTNSATVFLQQIGRGLRTHQGKDALVILDFIGQSRREFRFEFKLAALLGGAGPGRVKRAVENRFPPLPSGCVLELDEKSRSIILDNLKQWVRRTPSRLLTILQHLGHRLTLRQYLEEAGMTAHEFYTRTYLTQLRRAAGYIQTDETADEVMLGKKLKLLLHVDDPQRLQLYRDAAAGNLKWPFKNENDRRQLLMLLCTLFSRDVANDPEGYLNRLLGNPAICREIIELSEYLQDEIFHLPKTWQTPSEIPVKIHCRYSMHELMAAFDITSRQTGEFMQLRSGVYFDKKTKSNLLLATIDKSEKDYTAQTMYSEFAISPVLFHWQSQHRTKADSGPGRRHINHRELGVTPLLFARQRKRNQFRMTEPYLFLGPVNYVRHEQDRPMNIIWKLQTPMPADFLRSAKLAA